MSDNECESNSRSHEGSFIGDTPYTNFIRSYDESLSLPVPCEYKVSYAPTMESQIRKLRLSLEDYRELILSINSVLLWEKQWHASAILTGCTVVFTLLWLCDPSILTIISSIGLILTIGDYVLPSIVSSLFNNDNWHSHKQKKFEEVCTNIVLYKTKLELILTSYYRMRVTNSKMYFTITIAGLSFLIWLGSTVNNLFLSYLFVVVVLLLPGMTYNGFLNKVSDAVSKIFSDLVENAKSKVGQKKVD